MDVEGLRPKETERVDKDGKSAPVEDGKAAQEMARAYRLGQRAAGRTRQRRMAEVGLETRPVRRALARMGRPQGRKGAKASIVVARAAAEKVNEAREQARAVIRASQSRAGRMPHVKAE